ncbi:IS110 family transposase [Desulfonema ishimotonii]|uniref:IS110 family transposase n=1 Tax=Desulfonema ishimotonii TaxID=45657 RepID=A0A401G041_9BACT|nr:IS110 family transposase [Desulfonema ishimotonii]GBC62567.1 IS110 family transposase [Desulfonema ishimotonii]
MNIPGIDVSKNKLGCVLLTSSAPDKELYKKVPNTPVGFRQLITWSCKKARCESAQIHAVTEATGPYHENAALALYQAGMRISVINPARIKHFAKGIGVKAKNDKKDASVIARSGLMNKPPLWKPEPAEYRELRAMPGRPEALETDIRREKNRLEKIRAGRATETAEASLNRVIIFLREEKKSLRKQVRNHIDNHPNLKKDRSFLESVPGIGPVVSSWMLVLLQGGKRFDAAPKAASYVGLTPTEHQSGSSVLKRPRLSKAGPPVFRAKLYMAAMVAARYNPDAKELYQRLIEKGKAKMPALGAVMRKLVHICFGVIKNQAKYTSQVKNEG